ncbi:hypothetical protein ACI01D_000726 [Cronobacter sakazakii]|uniref:Uncharacterized protein n=1 Tax=Cronobacter sakazakii (strain ATCC BAA-894) TaxID=290339 RepID=A7MG05_CROS8|nr:MULTISPECIES: hypothetical protein [Enterobacteriaceae]ELQ6171399.1 hypothetical protein [Cronobacter dublinensis]ABU77578.1 hypothetical protein ESA_02329 [Cronobacter sakazakii ATCC BAA-894]ELY4377482.1 hypothetical protein [Cronobacter sakazakii]EMC4242953.1 hypothetical protein [Cronobacter sakazakii]EMC4360887.1 hypothetical protein [Cronobacter sakazakii]
MAITEASIKRTFTGTKALAVLSILGGLLVMFAVRREDGYVSTFTGDSAVIIIGMIATVLYGWVGMLVGLLTVPIAKMFSIESSSIKRVLSIIYWFVFSWAVYVIGFIVSYVVFGDDEATLIELKPAIAVASLVVASIHTGLFREMLNREQVSN